MVNETTRRRLATRGIALVLSACAGAPAAITKPDVDRIRHLQGTIRLFDQPAFQNWKIDVFARDDGWVELFLATVRREDAGFRPWVRFGDPLPWIIGRDFDSSKPREPVWTHAFFTPAEIRLATHFADSVLDGTLTPEASEKRFWHVAPSLLVRMKDNRQPFGKNSISSWYMSPPGIGGASGRRGIVNFGISSCLGTESDPALMGAEPSEPSRSIVRFFGCSTRPRIGRRQKGLFHARWLRIW